MVATPANLWHLVGGMVADALLMLAPFLGALMLAAIVANVAQTGPILSADPVKPDLSRLSPISGFRKIFSMRTLFDGLRAILKLAALSWVAWEALAGLIPQFFHLAAMSPASLGRTIIDDAAAAGFRIALVMALIALLDFAFAKRQFARQMRMSKRDLKDEHKHREGDPRIKSRIRTLRRELLQKTQAMGNTRNADVMITNPTHYAVALRYVQGEMPSPQVIAKGAGVGAALMRRIAQRHRIPIVENRQLARALYRVAGLEQHVPPSLYAQVARIMVWVFAMRRRSAEAAA
jgi:flagellar biosynthetic protein FlhB